MGSNHSKPFALVLMPFGEKFKDIYEAGIKPACQDAGATCERIDEQIFSENILERIYAEIRRADILIAEMTGRNANVFYETGYAHGLEKRVILLARSARHIPFDLRPYQHIIYGGSTPALKSQLERRVRWFVERQSEPAGADHPDQGTDSAETPCFMLPIMSLK